MSLDATLDVSSGRDGVEFTLTVQNAGTEFVELEFRSGLIADFVVREDGEEVWRWSDGRMITQAIETEALAPGESFSYSATWEDAGPGEYDVEALLQTRNADVGASETFSR